MADALVSVYRIWLILGGRTLLEVAQWIICRAINRAWRILSLPDSAHKAHSPAKKRAVFIPWVKNENKNDFRKEEVARPEGQGGCGVEKGGKHPIISLLLQPLLDMNLQGFGFPCRAGCLFHLVPSSSAILIVLQGNLGHVVWISLSPSVMGICRQHLLLGRDLPKG